MRLLFDIRCACIYLGSRAEIDKHHSVRSVGLEEELPRDITDHEMARVAHYQDYTIVTKDIDLVKLAVENKTKIAVLEDRFFKSNNCRPGYLNSKGRDEAATCNILFSGHLATVTRT